MGWIIPDPVLNLSKIESTTAVSIAIDEFLLLNASHFWNARRRHHVLKAF
jgi:hypothetical protein